MRSRRRKVDDYLREPYARVLIPDADTGTYTALIAEFPGCISEGETVEEAYRSLEESAKDWLDAATRSGQDVPEPEASMEYAGRIALRLSRSLHRDVSRLAHRDGVSVNTFISCALAEKVGAVTVYRVLAEKVDERMSHAVNRAIEIATDYAPQDTAATSNDYRSPEELH